MPVLQVLPCLLVAYTILHHVHDVRCEPTVHGSVSVNAGSLLKIISKYVAVLVKFDSTIATDSSETIEEFGKVVNASMGTPDIMIVEVNIEGYGDVRHNSDLAEKYNINRNQYPVYKLFLNGDENHPIDFNSHSVMATDIVQFVTKRSGLWMGLDGCVEELDDLANKLFLTEDRKGRQTILQKAIDYESKLDKGTAVKSWAKMYVSIMKQGVDNGIEVVSAEQYRVTKLVTEGKISDVKRMQLYDKLNILKTMHSTYYYHDEL